MKIAIPMKPISVNVAWQGRRFMTKEYKQFCKDIALFMPKHKISGYVQVHYKFFLKNWKATDEGNLEKCLSDCIVKAGLIDDDRFIMRHILEKFPAKEDRIEVEISEYEFNLGATK